MLATISVECSISDAVRAAEEDDGGGELQCN